MHTANLVVTVGSESRYNQVTFVSEEKRGITIGRQVDAGTEFLLRHVGRPPNLLAGAGLQTDQFAAGFRRVHVVALQEGGRGVAQDSLGDGSRLRPEQRGRRLVGV